MAEPSKVKNMLRELTEIEYFEFTRRWDEAMAITEHAQKYFFKETLLKGEFSEHQHKAKNPWFWGFLTLSLITEFIFHEGSWFKADWNFGSYLLSICFMYYLAYLYQSYSIEKSQKDNHETLDNLRFKWIAITGNSLSFWEIKQHLDIDGELVWGKYSVWRESLYENLKDKINYNEYRISMLEL